MDIRHLTYFIEVAKHKSFTKAADSLHITQPSISKMIRLLEEELGVCLLDRSGRQVELTDAGRAVLNQAQHILSSFHNLTSELADVMHLKQGSIIMGLPPMVGSSFFASVIGEFSHLYPRITMQLIEVGSKAVELGVEDGSLDLGVVMLPVKPNTFDMFSFIEDPLMLLVPPNHKLAGNSFVYWSELRDEAFVLFREDFALHDRIIERCIQSGFQPKIICQSSQWDFMAEMVAAGLGVALLPQRICRELDPQRVRSIPLADPQVLWHLAVIWAKDKYLSFACREWLQFASSRLGAPLNLKFAEK